jgi:putative Mg2+ transporter-C (MgtC) family protein
MPHLVEIGWGVAQATELSFVSNLCLAAILGSLMGLERSLSGKHAGMRTYALVSLGSCLFVILGTLASYQLANFAGVNPLQIAGSIVIGIGFIGSGLMVFRGEHPVELTTASGIWVVAGIGMACGFGLYLLALTATMIAVLVFSVFARVENKLRVRFGADGE